MAGPPLKPTPVRPVPPPLNTPEGQAALEEREAAAAASKELPKWRRGFRTACTWLFLILLGGVVMQVGLAGAGLLSDTGDNQEFLDAHMAFAGILHLLAILIALAGFLGADRQAGISGIVLFLLMGIQFPLIHASGVTPSFHVLNALVIFTMALLMTLSRIPWRPHYLDAPRTP